MKMFGLRVPLNLSPSPSPIMLKIECYFSPKKSYVTLRVDLIIAVVVLV